MKRKLDKTHLAKKLRQGQTEAEKRFWSKVRAKKMGVRFRRQQQIGSYIVDFVCFERQLIVELDGGQHNESSADKSRDEWLRSEGYQVVRFWNSDVMKNIQGVLMKLADILSPSPSPSPQGRGISKAPTLRGERKKGVRATLPSR